MLIFIDYNQVFFPFAGSEYAATYFKIAKIDSLGNDNSVPLGQLDNIFIYKSSTSQYVGYDLDILNEYLLYLKIYLDVYNIDIYSHLSSI